MQEGFWTFRFESPKNDMMREGADTDALHIPMSELFPQGEGPKAKEIGIIDDAQLQEIISLWHKIPGEARGSAYVMIKGMLIAAQQLPQK